MFFFLLIHFFSRAIFLIFYFLFFKHSHYLKYQLLIPTSHISLPKVFLSMEYLVASSNALCAKPTAPEATFNKNSLYYNTYIYRFLVHGIFFISVKKIKKIKTIIFSIWDFHSCISFFVWLVCLLVATF